MHCTLYDDCIVECLDLLGSLAPVTECTSGPNKIGADLTTATGVGWIRSQHALSYLVSFQQAADRQIEELVRFLALGFTIPIEASRPFAGIETLCFESLGICLAFVRGRAVACSHSRSY